MTGVPLLSAEGPPLPLVGHFRVCVLGKVCFWIRKNGCFGSSIPGPVAHLLQGRRLFEGMNTLRPSRAGVQVLRHVGQGADRH